MRRCSTAMVGRSQADRTAAGRDREGRAAGPPDGAGARRFFSRIRHPGMQIPGAHGFRTESRSGNGDTNHFPTRPPTCHHRRRLLDLVRSVCPVRQVVACACRFEGGFLQIVRDFHPRTPNPRKSGIEQGDTLGETVSLASPPPSTIHRSSSHASCAVPRQAAPNPCKSKSNLRTPCYVVWSPCRGHGRGSGPSCQDTSLLGNASPTG